MIIENDTRDKNAVCYLFVANSIFFLLLASILDIVGSPDKSGGQPRLAWKAIHIGLADVGNLGQA